MSTTIDAEVQEHLDTRLAAYKSAMEAWIASIKAEEDFATPDHSMKEWEDWDQAGFKEAELRDKAKAARVLYAEALREKLYNF